MTKKENTTELQKVEQKKFVFPDVRVLLFCFTVLAAVLTWIVPAGEFDTEKVGNLTRVIPGTFHYVEQCPQGIWEVFNATVMGFTKQASLISMICFIGAAIYMMQETGAFELAFRRLIRRSGNEYLLIFILMVLISIGGATGVFANPAVALVPIGIVLSSSMGLDKAVGALMIYWGAYCGFNVGWAVPASLGTAQTIAELPMFSGYQVRILFHIINFTLTYVFLLKYIVEIKKDHTKSLNYTAGMSRSDVLGMKLSSADTDEDEKLTIAQILTLIVMLAAIAAVIVGSIKFSWSYTHFSTVFFMAAIAIGIINRYSPNKISKIFVKGFAKMIPASSVVGFANGISTILNAGKILNTLVYALSIPIGQAGAVGGSVLMFIANFFINCFIGSGSGQATAVMPIMAPLADVTGITRQVAVQAFQFGDGLCNSITPTATTLMACLSLGEITWDKYMKKFWPLFLCQVVFASVSVAILQMIGWTGL